MESNGWIKLHRKLQAKGYYKNSQYVHLWVHLLLLANHKEHEYMHDGGLVMIKEGQLITGRKELSRATGIAETTIERILKLLENEHQIGQQKTNKYRVITILNWKEHQNRTEERTSSGHLADTYKNDKKEKNIAVAIAPAAIEVVHQAPEESERLQKKQTYPNARKAFKWFPEYDPSWGINVTELKAGELLFDRGEEKVRKNIKYCVPRMEMDGFPIHRLTPYLLITNWKRIHEYSQR